MSLAFLSTIDNMFANMLPPDVKANRLTLNKSGLLLLGQDNNTFEKIFRRVKESV